MASIYAHQAGIFTKCLLGANKNKGNLTYYPFLFACEQFIPMCIGNTGRVLDAAAESPVYPYVYREHCRSHRYVHRGNGLSLCV